jgi:cell division protein FtsB
MPSSKQTDPGQDPHPAWYLVLVLSAGLSSIAVAYFVKGGVGDMNRLQEQKEELREKIAEKKEKYRKLQARRERLHRDPYLIEKLARQRLGLGRPGEKRVRMEVDEATAPLDAESGGEESPGISGTIE